jgi:hypothetical protein
MATRESAMRPFLRQVPAYVTVIGYFLAITWGPLWHDHHHCCSHSLDTETNCCLQSVTEDAPPHCCGHHHDHGNCCEEDGKSSSSVDGSSSPPCHSPLHDDDCAVCQFLAHPPLATPVVKVVDVSAPVLVYVSPSVPLAERLTPDAYDSRGPPLV